MENENNHLLVLWIFMFGLGMIICYLFFSLYKDNLQFLENTEVTEATIIDSIKKESKIIPVYNYTIKYEVNNSKFNGEINSFFNYKNNKTMKIFYESNNPAWIMEYKCNWRHLTLFLISILFPAYAFFYIMLYLIRVFIAKNIIKNNNSVIADITSIKKNHRIKEGGWFPYYLECSYQNKTYESYGITYDQYIYIKEKNIKKIKLYFGNKEKYYVDINSINEKKEG